MADSLRGQLMQWLLLPLFVLLAGDTYLAYQTARDAVNAAYDRSLLGAARAIADGVVERDGVTEVDLPYSAFEIFESQVKERIYYNVVTDQGSVIAGYADLPRIAGTPQKPGEPAFHETDYRGERIRIVALPKQLYGSRAVSTLTVQVAETLGSRALLVRGVLTDSIRRQLLQVAVTVLLVWLGISRGLRPLRRLRDRILARASTDLSPVETTAVQSEVRPLIEAFNQHTTRVAGVLAAQGQFISDASHQLRTPLTVLKTQAELLQRTADPAAQREIIDAMVQTTDQTVRLSRQLLAMARSERAGTDAEWREVRLDRIVADAMREFIDAARAKNMEIAFECAPGNFSMFGNPTLLHEMIANLIDNAVRYGPTGGPITASVASDASEIVMRIQDAGPGIPPGERDRVFERFYRLPGSAVEGSGLGLSIARQVCVLHQAKIELLDVQDGHGLMVEVRFSRLVRAQDSASERLA